MVSGMKPLTLKTIQRTVVMYSDEELAPGAQRWGLTVAQERERLGFLQSEQSQWPIGLKQVMVRAKSGDYPGQPTFSSDIMNWSIVKWLKSQPVAIAA